VRTSLFLKTQAELLADTQARMTDANEGLASDIQYHIAINEAVRMWGSRVALPQLYSFASALSSGTFEYTLPSYIRPPFRVQVKSSTYAYLGVQVLDDNNNYTWQDLAGYSVEPDGSGGWKLRLPFSPPTEDARILWWAENGPMPTAAVTMTAGCDADDTSIVLTVSGSPDVVAFGVVKADSEYIVYQNLTRTSATSYTISNCLRGQYGTTAASHSAAAAVTWTIGVDDQRLWVQLYDYVAAYIHAMQLHKSTTEDLGRHEKLMSYYQQKADNFWRSSGYVSQRSGRVLLTHTGVGPITW
jgi:hypothetical protein